MIDTYLMVYIILTRLFELILSKKNTRILLEEGAIEYFKFHYKFIVLYHVIFIVFFFAKSLSNEIIKIEYLYIFFLVQILRYKIIFDLGKYWTTRIIVIDKPLINTWIFRSLRHPNYLVVFFEVILVCLFFNDFYSLIFFTTINSILLGVRIFYEEKANKYRRKL